MADGREGEARTSNCRIPCEEVGDTGAIRQDQWAELRGLCHCPRVKDRRDTACLSQPRCRTWVHVASGEAGHLGANMGSAVYYLGGRSWTNLEPLCVSVSPPT